MTMRRLIGLVALFLVLAVPVLAQAPPLAAITEEARQHLATTLSVLQDTDEYRAYIKTDAYKSYASARAILQALEQRQAQEAAAKPAPSAPEVKPDATLKDAPPAKATPAKPAAKK
jgi:hypothetical protein